MTKSVSTGRSHRGLFRFGLLLFFSAALLVILDCWLAFTRPQPLDWSEDDRLHCACGDEWFHCPWLVLPAHSQAGYTFWITTDARGFRHIDPLTIEKNSARRIITLGDSYTFGWGVNDGEDYPAQLQEILNQRRGEHRYEVINAGYEGTSIARQLNIYRQLGCDLEHDAVLLLFFPNDWDDLRFWYLTREPAERPSRRFGARDILFRRYARIFFSLRPGRFEVQFYRRFLTELNTAVTGAGAELALMSLTPDHFELNLLSDLAREAGCRFLDVSECYSCMNASRIAPPAESHFDAAGNRMLAETIADCLPSTW